MAGHTPGPWKLETVKTSIGVCHKIGEFPSGGVRPITYGCVYEDGMHLWRVMDRMDSELLANARLMAAAPDLLEACKRSLDWLSSYPGGGAMSAYDAVRAAISKAEGAQE